MKKNDEKVELTVEEYVELTAESEAMKEQMALQAEELAETKEELATTKENLKEMVKTLSETRLMLHGALECQILAEEAANDCLMEMKKFLMHWLTKQNQTSVNHMLKLYKPQQRVKMMAALLEYLIFGRKLKLEREVERTHFNIICGRIDDDCITLPPHSLMVKLMKKYGLNEALRQLALEE